MKEKSTKNFKEKKSDAKRKPTSRRNHSEKKSADRKPKTISSAPKKNVKKEIVTPSKVVTKPVSTPAFEDENDTMRLNRYLAHAGVAARRKADVLIAGGAVTVNNKVVTEMGYRVKPTDMVRFKGAVVQPKVNFVYILLNKPKNTITTVSDEKDRKTVMELVAKATDERVFPVGRLDRNTTGVLLLTNDGVFAQKLSHPSFEIDKVYHATLDKPLTAAHFQQIKNGVTLEDGLAKVNDLGYPDPNDASQVGIEIHIGKNRIVRRIFEHLGYEVIKLDRVMYAGLTKKDLARGRYRMLTALEVAQLKKK